MKPQKPRPLNLRVGDLVEVRSEQEILTTLDDQGATDGLPFMPEMLEFCGKRFRVDKRADKTCNTITVMESRRLHDTVHLENLRCSGSDHGGCQAQCFLFWKESWLKRVQEPVVASQPISPSAERHAPAFELRCDKPRLYQLTQRQDISGESEIHYRCQATDLLKASESLPWWDVRQYLRDIWSGNVRVLHVAKVFLFRLFLKSLKVGIAYRSQIWAYNRFQSWRGGTPYPYREGQLDKTLCETLDLRPGELVQVKSHDEILKTLSKKNKNRGLLFGEEMAPYCGGIRRVRARVERIVDERTGKMMALPGECLILEGAICRGDYSEKRLFCPRSIFPFWREIWLKRVKETGNDRTQRDSPAPGHARDTA
jgi:hypothetical protein